MALTDFMGKWKNKSGNILEIKPFSNIALKVDFISGQTGQSVIREYYGNKKSTDMEGKLDYYESSLEIDLWEKGKGFQLVLLYDQIDLDNGKTAICLAPGLSQYLNSNLTEQYGHLFYPLEYYQQI
jgi:hypothetical protein